MWKYNGFIYWFNSEMKPGRLRYTKGTKEAMSLMGMELWIFLVLGKFKMVFFSCSFWFLKWNIQCHILCSCSPKVTAGSGCADVGLHVDPLFRGSGRWCNLCCLLGQYWAITWNSVFSAAGINPFYFVLPWLSLQSIPRAQDELLLVW